MECCDTMLSSTWWDSIMELSVKKIWRSLSAENTPNYNILFCRLYSWTFAVLKIQAMMKIIMDWFEGTRNINLSGDESYTGHTRTLCCLPCSWCAISLNTWMGVGYQASFVACQYFKAKATTTMGLVWQTFMTRKFSNWESRTAF